MDRKKVIFAYEMAIIVPLVLLSIVSTLTQTVIIATVPGLICTIVITISCLLFVHFKLRNKLNDVTAKLVRTYDFDCDPEALSRKGGQTAFNAMEAREKGDALGSGDAWFLGYYALASIDMGEVEGAERIAAAILEDSAQAKFADQAHMLISVEPVVLRLRGAEAALDVLAKAEESCGFAQKDNMADVLAFINNERILLQAMIDGDQDVLLTLFNKTMNSNGAPVRLRVLAADAIASIYRARGDEGSETHALNFVEEYGNKLPVVKAAEARLEELLSE